MYSDLVIDLVFLHGFYSSPRSSKIQFLKKEIMNSEIGDHIGEMIAINLYPNPADFDTMTVSSLLLKMDQQISSLSNPIVLIGSSHGGLLARSYVDQYPNKVKAIILLAPAINFLDEAKLTHLDEWDLWSKQGHISVFHGAFQQEVKWTWKYITDLKQFSGNHSKLPVPALLIHGKKDSVIPFEKSVEFVNKQLTQGVEVDAHYLTEGNHPLNNVLDQLRALVINWLREKVIPK